MSQSAHVFDGLPGPLLDALRVLARTPQLTVALDFDGVLAPLVDRPGDARSDSNSLKAIADLVELSGTTVVLVSGRSLDNLRTVSGSPGNVLLVGSHGAEYDIGDGHAGMSLTAEEKRALTELQGAMRDVVARHPDARLEYKPAGVTLHTRGVNPDAARAAQRDASRTVSAAVPGVTHRSGKDVLEFSVVAATKGDAMQRLRLHTAATAMLYAGDDVTDEDAFAALEPGDVSVKVGEGSTVASHRVHGTPEVAQMLRVLASDRRNHLLGA
ncbi:trehalose-phosphatase [Paramicrobacterium agarici]|uniref:trehalose-phosphatase n=1 Tax=Paramicrobacterium agarici TaxID=630514 RepID=UPI00114E3FDA|nr:trehalose-phosphatase [Microbacterium agarici]TQO21501.1 trehalose 6-phosphatase [Microbacterium agarici]